MPPPHKSCSSGTDGLSADEIDPDFLCFLRHVRPEGQGYVVEIPSKDGSSRPQVIRYEEPIAAPNAEHPAANCDGGTRSAASSEEEHSSVAGEVPSGAASPPTGPDMVNDSQWMFEMGKVKEEVENDSDKDEGKGNVGLDLQMVNNVECEVDDEEEEKPSNVILARTPESEPSNSEASSGQGHSAMLCNASVKEEEDCNKNEGIDTAGPDTELVNVFELESEMEVDEEEEEEEPLNVPVTRPPELEPSNREASSRQGHSAMLCNASESPANILSQELEGVIWPSHIFERPESDFKQKLMKDLNRPFNRKEYDELFAKATGRTPVMKQRRTRRRVTDYPWEHEMGKSYFDCYPDLADQVEGESSYPNRLALLRGFFFWLQNIGHDEQFRPWTDDYKNYRVSVGLQPRSRRRGRRAP